MLHYLEKIDNAKSSFLKSLMKKKWTFVHCKDKQVKFILILRLEVE